MRKSKVAKFRVKIATFQAKTNQFQALMATMLDGNQVNVFVKSVKNSQTVVKISQISP